MKNIVKFFALITLVERNHNFTSIDGDCRTILNFVATRQIEHLPNDAATILEHLDIPRPTVYRKLTVLKDKRLIKEKWADQKLNYELDHAGERFLSELHNEAKALLAAKE